MPTLDEYEAALDRLGQDKATAAIIVPKAPPDEAAKTLDNSVKQNVPFSIGNADPKTFNDQAALNENINALVGSPGLQNYVTKNDYAPHVSSDDLPHLGMVSKMLDGLYYGWGSGQRLSTQGRIMSAYEIKGALGEQPEIPEDEKALLEEQAAEPKEESLLYKVPYAAAQFISHGVAAMASPEVLTTAGVGALAAGAVTAEVGAPAAFMLTYPTAVMAKMAMDDWVSGYLSAKNEVSPTGEKMSEGAAQAVGAAVGAVSFAGLKFGGGTVAKEFVKDGIMEVAKKPTVMRALNQIATEVSKTSLEGGLLTAGMNSLDIVAEDSIKAMAAPSFQTIWNDPVKREEFRANMLRSFEEGAIIGGTVKFPFAGWGGVADAVLGRQARVDMDNIKAAQDALQQSKTFGRSLEAAAAFVDSNLDVGGRQQNVEVTAEALDRILGGKAAEIFARPEDRDEFDAALARARRGNGSIEMPLSQFLTHATPEVRQALENDTRVHTNVPTLNEHAEAQEATTLADFQAPARPQGLVVRIPGVSEDFPVPADLQKVAKREMWLTSLFADAKSAGMTQAEFALHSKHLEDQDRQAYEDEVARKQRLLKKQMTQTWKDNEADMRARVTNDLIYQPDIMADRYFREGKIGPHSRDVLKLDADYIKETYGPSVLTNLPKWAVTKRGGIDPNVVAPLLNFNSGGALLASLTRLVRERGDIPPGQYFRRLVEDEVERRMDDQFGDPEEKSMEAAREAVGTGGMANLLSDNLFYAARRIWGDLPGQITRDAIDRQIKDDFNNENYRKVNPAKFGRDAGTAGRRAYLAEMRGNSEKSFQGALDQFYSFQKMREAYAFAKERAKTEKLMKFYQKNLTEKETNTKQEFTDQIHALLNMVDETIPRTQRNLSNTNAMIEGIDRFIKRQADDNSIYVEPPVIPRGKTLDQFTVEEFRDFGKTLQSLHEGGRLQRKFELAGKKIELDDLAGRIKSDIESVGGRVKSMDDPGIVQLGRAGLATFTMPETIAKWASNNDLRGAFISTVYRPLKAADLWKQDKMKAISDDLAKLKSPVGWFRRLTQTLPPLVNKDGKEYPMNYGAMIRIMLEHGNDSNWKGFLAGRNFDEGTVDSWLRRVETKGDWDFVQGIWDVLAKHMAPEVEKRTREMTGVATDLIDPRPVNTPFGTYKGGYIPRVPDATWKLYRRKQDLKDPFEDSPLFMNMPTASALKRRTGAIYPTSLSPTDWIPAVKEAMHVLAFAQPLRDAHEIMNHPDVRQAFGEAFGPEELKGFQNFLKRVASNDGLLDLGPLHWWENVNRFMRQDAAVVLVGGSKFTANIHGASALFQGMQMVGEEAGARGVAKYWEAVAKDLPIGIVKQKFAKAVGLLTRSPASRNNFIDRNLDESSELRNRGHNTDTDLRQQYEAALGKRGFMAWRSMYSQWAMSMFSFLDQYTAHAAYHAIKETLMEQGESFENARDIAEARVRAAHGDSSLTGAAPIMRGPESFRWAMLFGGYFVHNVNQNRETARFLEGKSDLKAISRISRVATRSLSLIFLGAMAHEFLGGYDPDAQEDESWPHWIARKMTDPWAYADQLLFGVPYMRQLLYGARGVAEGKKKLTDLPVPPQFGVIDSLLKLGMDVRKSVEEGHLTDDWLEHSIESMGWGAGFGDKIDARRMQYLWDNFQGNVSPQDFWEWLHDLGRYEKGEGKKVRRGQ